MNNLETTDMENLGIVVSGIQNFDEVFEQWMSFEEGNSGWIGLAKERGFESVREWRLNAYLKPFGIIDFDGEWMECDVEDYSLLMQNLYIGPYNSWRDYYGNDREHATFLGNLDGYSELQRGSIFENGKVLGLRDNFPEGTTLIAVTDGRKVCLLDGHHRAAALAVMMEKDGMSNFELQKLNVKLKMLDMSGDQRAFDRLFYYEG